MNTTKLVKIGNSKGVILGRHILAHYNLDEGATIEISDESDEYILLKPIKKPRKGWEAAFKEMVDNGHDAIGLDDILDDDLNEI